jgi:GMP synthase (glutamine-hydrolysing)
MQEEFIGKEIKRIREICGPKGRVIGAVSGGVDSTVAAKLMHEAIGNRYVSVETSSILDKPNTLLF